MKKFFAEFFPNKFDDCQIDVEQFNKKNSKIRITTSEGTILHIINGKLKKNKYGTKRIKEVQQEHIVAIKANNTFCYLNKNLQLSILNFSSYHPTKQFRPPIIIFKSSKEKALLLLYLNPLSKANNGYIVNQGHFDLTKDFNLEETFFLFPKTNLPK